MSMTNSHLLTIDFHGIVLPKCELTPNIDPTPLSPIVLLMNVKETVPLAATKCQQDHLASGHFKKKWQRGEPRTWP